MDTILKYFPSLTTLQRDQFTKLGILYPQWNACINVISRKDIDNLYINHILHSLAIAKFLNPATGSNILDMGTGGGFPGIPLAIMFPDCKFHLIDRIGKKIKVASDIAEKIGLQNVSFQHGDIGECHNHYDFVVSRAVMKLDELIPLVRKNISSQNKNAYPNGLICLKGGDLNEEIKSIRHPLIEVSLSDYFNEDFYKTKKLIYVQL